MTPDPTPPLPDAALDAMAERVTQVQNLSSRSDDEGRWLREALATRLITEDVPALIAALRASRTVPHSTTVKWTADGELITVPLAEWDAPSLSDFEIEVIAAAHLNDEGGCRSGPCPGENGQGWCDAAMLLVSLRDARAERDASRARVAALRWALDGLVQDIEHYGAHGVRPSSSAINAAKAALAASAAPPASESTEKGD